MRLVGSAAVLTGAARLDGLGHAFSKVLALANVDVIHATESARVTAEKTGQRTLAVACGMKSRADIFNWAW